MYCNHEYRANHSLHRAAIEGNPAVVEALLLHKPDANAVDLEGKSEY
jgi:hypothetical protein